MMDDIDAEMRSSKGVVCSAPSSGSKFVLRDAFETNVGTRRASSQRYRRRCFESDGIVRDSIIIAVLL
jgi:hypothetical protein